MAQDVQLSSAATSALRTCDDLIRAATVWGAC